MGQCSSCECCEPKPYAASAGSTPRGTTMKASDLSPPSPRKIHGRWSPRKAIANATDSSKPSPRPQFLAVPGMTPTGSGNHAEATSPASSSGNSASPPPQSLSARDASIPTITESPPSHTIVLRLPALLYDQSQRDVSIPLPPLQELQLLHDSRMAEGGSLASPPPCARHLMMHPDVVDVVQSFDTTEADRRARTTILIRPKRLSPTAVQRAAADLGVNP